MPTERSRPSVAVVGCGHWGKNLIRNFYQLGNLTGLFDADPARLDSFASQHPKLKKYRDWTEILEDAELDALAISTPAETHYKLGLAALRAGKDVFVEKPLALTPDEGRFMVEAAREGKRILMVGHLLLYHPAVLTMQQLLESGELGSLEYIYSNRVSLGKIRREENALWSFAPHDISVMVFEDSRATDKLLLFDKQIVLSNGVFEVTQPTGTPVAFASGEPLRLECEHFLTCIERRQQPRTSGESGVDVLRVLQACQRSLQLNGEPVQVDAMFAKAVAVL